jgi:hypothetical protein
MVGTNSGEEVLRHVVLFSFKPATSAEDQERLALAFAALPSKIAEIIDFEWGSDVSVEGKTEGYTHCFIVTFANEEGRNTYLPHPAHKEFGQLLRGHLEKVLVLDYWARR